MFFSFSRSVFLVCNSRLPDNNAIQRYFVIQSFHVFFMVYFREGQLQWGFRRAVDCTQGQGEHHVSSRLSLQRKEGLRHSSRPLRQCQQVRNVDPEDDRSEIVQDLGLQVLHNPGQVVRHVGEDARISDPAFQSAKGYQPYLPHRFLSRPPGYQGASTVAITSVPI